MQFKNIIGQEAIIKRFQQSIDEQRISHAQLFFGTAGCGKIALAIAYVQYLFCTNRQNGDSCGECLSCKKISKFAHPDLHFIYPNFANSKEKKKGSLDYLPEWRKMLTESGGYPDFSDWVRRNKSENKKATIYKEDVEQIIKVVNYKSYESEYKVVIVWLPEKLDNKIAPKLLKVLEEPPPKTLFLLLTENPSLLLSTILSRTQMIKIPAINKNILAQHLISEKGIEAQEAFRVCMLSAGNYPKTLELLENGDDNSDYFELFREWMRYCYGGDVPGIWTKAEVFAKMSRENQKAFLSYSLHAIQWCNWMNYGMEENVRLQGEEAAFFNKFSKWITPKNLTLFSEEFDKSIGHVERYANPTLLFTDISMKCAMWLKR